MLAGALAGTVLPAGAAHAQTEESCATGQVIVGSSVPITFDGCGVWSNQGGPWVMHVHEFSQVGPGRAGGPAPNPGNPAGGPGPPLVTKMVDKTLMCHSIRAFAGGHRESDNCA